MSHAEAVVRAIHAELIAKYPAMAACLVVEDEPAGDFGLAHYYGRTPAGCARVSFDVGHTPPRARVAHELGGHDLHRGGTPIGGPFWMEPDDPVLLGYWDAMQYTTSLRDAIDTALRVERERGFAAAWPYYPGEQLADTVGWINYPGEGWGGADPGIYGGSYAADRLARVEAFLRSVRPAAAQPPTEVDDMDRATYDRWWIENMRAHVTPTVVAIKDSYNDHEHDLVGSQLGRTSAPKVTLGNEPEGG